MNSSLKSILFIGILAGVVGVFYALSTLDAPPDMPPLEQHTLKFNLNQELIGLSDFTLATVDEEGEPIPKTTKGIAKSINMVCTTCHGKVGADLSAHPCQTINAPCLTEKHPPKSTCIKCHRMGKGEPKVTAQLPPAAPAVPDPKGSKLAPGADAGTKATGPQDEKKPEPSGSGW